jgi:hypothetical protein
LNVVARDSKGLAAVVASNKAPIERSELMLRMLKIL